MDEDLMPPDSDDEIEQISAVAGGELTISPKTLSLIDDIRNLESVSTSGKVKSGTKEELEKTKEGGEGVVRTENISQYMDIKTKSFIEWIERGRQESKHILESMKPQVLLEAIEQGNQTEFTRAVTQERAIMALEEKIDKLGQKVSYLQNRMENIDQKVNRLTELFQNRYLYE